MNALDDVGSRTPVVLELLGTIVNADVGALTDIFVMGALIGVLNPTK
jgi:hypothetical protein